MRARLSMLHGQPGHSHPPPLVMPHPAAGKCTDALMLQRDVDIILL